MAGRIVIQESARLVVRKRLYKRNNTIGVQHVRTILLAICCRQPQLQKSGGIFVIII